MPTPLFLELAQMHPSQQKPDDHDNVREPRQSVVTLADQSLDKYQARKFGLTFFVLQLLSFCSVILKNLLTVFSKVLVF